MELILDTNNLYSDRSQGFTGEAATVSLPNSEWCTAGLIEQSIFPLSSEKFPPVGDRLTTGQCVENKTGQWSAS